MSVDYKAERLQILSGTNYFTVTVSPASIPTSTEVSGSIARATDGSLWRSLNGGIWSPLAVNLSVSLTSSSAYTQTASLDVTGNLDWLCPAGTNTLPRSVAAGSLHGKRQGLGVLTNGFDWIYTAGIVAFTNSPGSSSPLFTASLQDDLDAQSQLSTQTGQGLGGTNLTYGFRMVVPASPLGRSLYVWTSQFSTWVTVTASLSDGANPQAVATGWISAANNTRQDRVWRIDYTGSLGSQMNVYFQVVNTGTSQNIMFLAAALSGNL